MRILLADKFPDRYREEISKLGHECDYQPDLGADELDRAIGNAGVLVVRSTKVSAGVLGAGPNLELVIRAGAGTNTIDVASATEKNIRVCNVPGKNAIAVAELTMGLILAIDRNIPDNVIDLRAGQWDKKKYSEASGILGSRIGIVGTGAIGLAVATRAHAFGMHIVVLEKPNRSPATIEVLQKVNATYVPDLKSLAETCDVLTFHVPAAAETKAIVNADLLSHMRRGAMLINTSRGDVVDEKALRDALDNKGLRAGLDVFAEEPTEGRSAFESPLARHPNVYGTHHIGASTTQAQNAVAEGVVEILQALAKGEFLYCVNPIH